MTPIPLELPLKTSEAGALADLIYQQTKGRTLDDDLRSRLAARVSLMGLTSLRPYAASLQPDPIHPAGYYIAIDALSGPAPQPMLLRIAPASSPASGLFPNSLLIGRMRPGGGREIVINGIAFQSTDYRNIKTFAEQVDRAFLPRPQGPQPAIAVGNRHPEISLPAAFDAFRAILKTTGVNLASTVQLSATREMTTEEALENRDGEDPLAPGLTRVSIRHLYHAGLWAAIRTGWREGYTAEADHVIVSGDSPDDISRSVERAKEAIRQAAGYTKFTTDTSRLFELRADPRHPTPWSDSVVHERFEGLFPAEEREWILAEFSKSFQIGDAAYHLDKGEVVRLAVKFGASLKLNEELFDFIRRTKVEQGFGRSFDFEPSIDEAETLTTPQEMIFYMYWLKARGRAAQLVPPNLGFKKRQAYPEMIETTPGHGLGLREYAAHKMWPELLPRVERDFGGKPLEELASRVAQLADVARHFNGTLSIHSGSGKQAEVLESIGRATAGRFNYKISGELQLQLLDVLSEQPPDSPWQKLYDRMVERANGFAAAGAFGADSELAARYTGSSLGDSARGRVDGNLFLVFWLGNVVGSRDVHSPGEDHRFFKEKIDELPQHLVDETRRRNTGYIVWLAERLRG